jgi:hypothetical protein
MRLRWYWASALPATASGCSRAAARGKSRWAQARRAALRVSAGLAAGFGVVTGVGVLAGAELLVAVLAAWAGLLSAQAGVLLRLLPMMRARATLRIRP